MSVFDWKVGWTSINNKTTEVTITDAITVSIDKSTEIKNNLCNVTLKNSATNWADDGTTIIGDHVDSSTQLINFNEEDRIRVWASILTNAAEVDTDWYDDARLLGSFAVREYQIQTTENSSRIQLQAVDSAYLLFNSVLNNTYGIANKYSSPGIIRNIARQFSEKNANTIDSTPGTHNDAGTEYACDAKFVSEGGYITDYRSDMSTTLNGAINDSVTTITLTDASSFENASDGVVVIDTEHIAYTAVSGNQLTGCTRGIDDTVAVSHSDTTTVYQGFPQISMAKIWKPVFEWIGELSQTTSTNYLSEVQSGGTLNYNRAFLFWVDEQNRAHWVYPDDISDLSIELGEEGRRSFKLEKSIFDAVNFVIYSCGEDMYGNGILYYYYNPDIEIASLKMRYQPMSKIVQEIMQNDISYGNGEGWTRETTNQDIYKQFVQDADYPIVPSFLADANKFRARLDQSARTDVANDTEYNDALREAAKERGLIESQKITTAMGGLRYSGMIALKGTHINPGDLVTITNPFVGLKTNNLRVKSVRHNINANSWETTIEIEEDETREA